MGRMQRREYGIYASGSNITGSITNNGGTISGSATATANVSEVTHFYTVSATATEAYGMYLNSVGVGGDINNSGTISAMLEAHSSVTGKNATTATGESVTASADNAAGIRLSSTTVGGKLVNSGSITASMSASADVQNLKSVTDEAFAEAYNAYGLYLDNSSITGNLENNSGTIHADGSASLNVQAPVKSYAYATVSSIYGIDLQSSSSVGGDLVNSGTIEAVADAHANVAQAGIGATGFKEEFELWVTCI